MISASRKIDHHESAKAAPLDVFRARAEARCLLIHNGLMDWHDGIDQLQAAAETQGLVAQYGQDRIQEIMAESFARGRYG
jgi:hypothetical protein